MTAHPLRTTNGPRARDRQDGFTLIEVMVALSIMSLIMLGLYQVLNATLRTRDLLSDEVTAARLGPTILDTIEQDLRRAWLLNLADDKVFLGEDRTLQGEPADSLVFVTKRPSSSTRRVDDREVSSELSEAGYRCRVNPELPDVLELWRRHDFHVDDEPLEDGVYELLHDRVVAFDIQYYEDLLLETEPVEDWDSEERNALPAKMRIVLGIEVGPRLDAEVVAQLAIDQTRYYERLFVFDSARDLALRVHPWVPAFSGAIVDGGGVGVGDDEDGEGQNDEQGGDGDGGGGGDDPFGSGNPNQGNPGDITFPIPGG